jgi:quercetin dioxygenase-like cupin family protein
MTSSAYQHIRELDLAGVRASAPDERFVQRLLNRASGAAHASVTLIKTPVGGGSPEGLHIHDFEQIFYLVEGVMDIEVDGVVSQAAAGSLIVFPPGVPHRNWNSSASPTVHLAIAAPAPAVGETGTRPASDR